LHNFSRRVMLATNCYGSVAIRSSLNLESSKILVFYYAATVLFLLLDFAFGFNIRLAFLEPYPAGRIAYYGICFFCLGLMLWRPHWTVLIGAFESLVTLSALIISMGMRTLLVTDQMLETGGGFVTMPEIYNFLISGAVAYLAWVRGISQLRDQKIN